MTQLRCTLFALLGLTLAACTDDKTVVSVNYIYGDGIVGMETVHVSITQNGQKFETNFETPLLPGTEPEKLPDGGDGTGVVEIMVPDTQFFQRYELDGFKDGEATLQVDLMKGAEVLFSETTKFDIREHGAVAAYAEFAIDPPAEDTGASSTAAASSAPTDAGSSDSGAAATSAPDAASSSAPADTSDAATTTTDSGTTAEAGTSSDAAATGSASSSDASTDGG